MEIQRLSGVSDPEPLPDKRHWRLHLKNNTPLDSDAVFALPTTRKETKHFLCEAWRYMKAKTFDGLLTSSTLKSTQLPQTDIDEAVRMGKFERCNESEINGTRLPYGWHGVNVFAVPELKGRRRLITEPLLNAAVNRKVIPNVSYPPRLARRQALRYCKYMLQIDFEAFYDAIPIPPELRNKFVFRKKDAFYRLCTLPTGARWSVAVGQAVTWTIVDIDTPVVIMTMIDNIVIAAREGEEEQFVSAIREVVRRIREANLMTSPDRESLAAASDAQLLQMGCEPNTFLGEEYAWNGQERLVRNSIKTVAKLGLAMQAESFTCRSFVSLVSLILYALHTTRLNPASAFSLLRAYRGVYRTVMEGRDWDSALGYLDSQVYHKMIELGRTLYQNDWWQIAEVVAPTYDEAHYNYIVVTDASFAGWGAYVQRMSDGTVGGYQQKWEKEDRLISTPYEPVKQGYGFFNAQHSAHAEPRAVELVLRQIMREGAPDGSKVAVITDHEAIVHAQRRSNGFGGIGRGYTLNKLFEYVYDLWFHRAIQVTFFYLSGKANPADSISRSFGGDPNDFGVCSFPAPFTRLPTLHSTYSPVCEGLSFKATRKDH